MSAGKSEIRVDAYDKVTGAAKYTDDVAPRTALAARVVRSTIAHGLVKRVDTSEAEKIPGVVKIVTCFDVPDIEFPTAGHPFTEDESHADVADRKLLNAHVRYFGDDVAAVIATDELSAARAMRAVRVEYEEYPFVLDPIEATAPGAPQIHGKYLNNILNHTGGAKGDYAAAAGEPGLLCVDKWYETPVVQHCHLENPICSAHMENGRIVITTSTQIPHIVRRIVGQALGIPWGDVRIIKPYIGGGFGNKQDALYEPLCAFLTTQVGGREVKLDLPREETFSSTRVRHAIKFHLTTYFRPDGTFVARRFESFSDQGAYASHGHGVAAKGTNAFAQLYKCAAYMFDAYTVYTNKAAAGAMRGYGIPQVTFALESHMDDIARVLDMDPVELRRKNLMDVGFTDSFSKNVNRWPSHEQCMEKGLDYIGWQEKREKYKNQTGNIRRGVGMSLFWYNTAVWPIAREASACRMTLNQDGTIQLMTGETEIGQGADTVFAQMAADAVGVPFDTVRVVSTQDTDISPFGTGAYASRQTYVAGMAIKQTGEILRGKILDAAAVLFRMAREDLEMEDGVIFEASGGSAVPLSALALKALYSLEHADHISAESTYQVKSNAFSFGCCFAEVEVDVRLCKVKLVDIINVHDCGKLINPQLAEAQVHGGMSMGIGYALGERMIYDDKTGRLLNGNLLDYKLSTAMDHPHLEARFVENAEPTSPFGTKALGEPPATPCAPAIRNAVLNAAGVECDAIPITPQRLFEKFTEGGLL